MPDPIPKLVLYTNGRFKLIKANLPESVKKDTEMQHKLLLLMAHKYRHYDWGTKLPEERFEELNTYIYNLVKDLYEE